MEAQYALVVNIMIGFVVVYFVIEILLNLNDIDNDTSNMVLLEWSKGKFFFIPFALGAIAGHLFLGTSDSGFKLSNGMYPVLILFGLTIVMLVIGNKVNFVKTKFFLTVLLAVGLLYGHLFWSMNYI
jgi:hypothetical protein